VRIALAGLLCSVGGKLGKVESLAGLAQRRASVPFTVGVPLALYCNRGARPILIGALQMQRNLMSAGCLFRSL
jgi:hypothetical protein